MMIPEERGDRLADRAALPPPEIPDRRDLLPGRDIERYGGCTSLKIIDNPRLK
jgi:hypothetical protein